MGATLLLWSGCGLIGLLLGCLLRAAKADSFTIFLVALSQTLALVAIMAGSHLLALQ